MSDEKLNIYQRLSRVRENVEYLKKDAEVQGYSAITHDMVTSAVRRHLIGYGVMIVPRQTGARSIDVGKTQKGATMIRYEADYEIDFVNIDSPDDRVTMTISAHANDHGDKAPGKAVSYATKYAMLKIFNIETGVNDEGRFEAHDDAVDRMVDRCIEAVEKGDWAALCSCDRTPEIWLDAWKKLDTHKKGKIKTLITKRDEYRDLLNDYAEKQDEDGIAQLWEELSDDGKPEVWRVLSDQTKAYVREIREKTE